MKRIILVLMMLFLVGCGNNLKDVKLTVNENIEMYVGDEQQINANVENSEAKLLFNSLDETIITVSESGLVKAVKEGSTEVEVSLEGTSIKKTVKVSVVKRVEPITLTIDVITQLKIDETAAIKVTTNDEKGVTYHSSDETIFSVSDGKITALKVGVATLTVTSKSDETIKVTKEITVKENIVINASDLLVIIGIDETLVVSHNDPLGVLFEVVDDTVIQLEGSIVSGLKEGTTQIKITSKTEPDYHILVDVVVKYEFVKLPEALFEFEVGETFIFNINATGDYTVSFSDETVANIIDGVYTALNVGETTITVSLNDYPDIQAVAEVKVYPSITLEVSDQFDLFIQQELNLEYTSNYPMKLTSSDEAIFIVADGVITGVKGGSAQLIFTTDVNPTFIHEVDVVVAGMPTRLTLSANRSIVLRETTQIVANFTPVGTYSYLTYSSSNESILTVDETGLVTGEGLGTATITVTSTIDARLNANISITVERINAVKPDIEPGETIEANGFSFVEGINAFKTLEEALVGSPKEVILIGTYSQAFSISQPAVLTGTPNTMISNVLTIASNDVTIRGMTFTGLGRIEAVDMYSNVSISKNTFKELTHADAAIYLTGQTDLMISYNTFSVNNQPGIHVENPKAKGITIKGNLINQASTAVKVHAAVAYESNLFLHVAWNKIDQVETGFDIDLSYQETFIHANSYVRFNEVTNYTFGAKAHSVNFVDFNLNYWGETPDYTKFENLNEEDLEGFYLDPTLIVSEADYNPRGAFYLKILNVIDEVNINDVITVDYKVLPKDVPASAVTLLTGDPSVMVIGYGNELSFKKSGFVDLILRSVFNDKINDTIRFEIITDPGIEIIPTDNKNHLLVGQTLQLETLVFPYRIQDTPVQFSVDNESIATINSTGLLTAVSKGIVTVRVELHNDETIYQTFKVEVYDKLDVENSIMDMISASMLTYTPQRSLLMYGNSNYTYTGYESVSRLIFEELFRDQSLMIPDCNSLTDPAKVTNCKLLRPGERPSMIDGLHTYNNKRVHYVTVHETANTNPNQGAYSHAVYLMNQVNGTVDLRQASWHFTMDDKELYQHIATNEMAWHAGDGTRKAGTTWSDTYGNQNIGGGNAHSIGIETSVAQNDDILKIWHRTAKLSAELTKEYNLPEDHVKFHQDFSSKWCPQSMLRAELTWIFREMVHYEYLRQHNFAGVAIEFISHNPEYVDNSGRVIQMPDRAQNVSFTIKVTSNGQVSEKVFYSYLPGTVH